MLEEVEATTGVDRTERRPEVEATAGVDRTERVPAVMAAWMANWIGRPVALHFVENSV